MNHDIFISYSSKQKSIADGVCHYLEENGFKCWMAPRDIPVGREYGDLIEEAIKTSKVVILVFSEAASISKWVKGEINVAFTEDKPILPFRIDETEIKGGFRVMLNQMHWIDAFPHYADRLPDLLNSVCGFLGCQPQKVSKVSDDRERLEAERKAKEEAERKLTFIVNGISFDMIKVEGGTFQMGSNDSDAYYDEKPVHGMTVSTFYMGETEVTQALWKAVMGSNPSWFEGDNLPVERVSWNDCQEFIRKLNSLTGRNFRLPTEAEWEFAARGGNKSNGYMYAGSNSISNVAWYDGNSGGKTHVVKDKSPNELGLYDMSGNVWEWCGDWYGNWYGDWYGSGSQITPQGPSSGSRRVLRGSCWDGSARYCRVSIRSSGIPDYRDDSSGFRLALPQ